MLNTCRFKKNQKIKNDNFTHAIQTIIIQLENSSTFSVGQFLVIFREQARHVDRFRGAQDGLFWSILCAGTWVLSYFMGGELNVCAQTCGLLVLVWAGGSTSVCGHVGFKRFASCCCEFMCRCFYFSVLARA